LGHYATRRESFILLVGFFVFVFALSPSDLSRKKRNYPKTVFKKKKKEREGER
jgi:hypothetical protein